MQTKVFYKGIPYKPESLKKIGNGAEGSVFSLNSGSNLAMKLYHGWDSLDINFSNLTDEDRKRIAKMERAGKKLLELPQGLTDRVAKPVGLVLDERRRFIVGYCMPFIDGFTLSNFESKAFRRNLPSLNITIDALKELHAVVHSLHQHDVLVVDFASDNVIYQRIARFLRVYMCDFDSMAWGRFKGDVFHWHMVDPRILKQTPKGIDLAGDFSKETDWYAFTVITMSTLTTINPYDGPIASPALNKWKAISKEQRPLFRLNVFHPEVEYPTAGIALDYFPKDLVSYWKETLSGNLRGEFPIRLLNTLSWKVCPKCNKNYASDRCPTCH